MRTARNLLKVVLVACLCMSAPAGAKLIQHLDASVPESVVVSGGVVQQWNDLSGNGNDAVANRGNVLYPSTPLAGGLVGIDFGYDRTDLQLFDVEGTNALLNFTNEAAGNTGFTVFVAFRTDVMDDDQHVLGAKHNLDGFSFRVETDGDVGGRLDNQNPAAAGVVPGDTLVLGFSFEAATGDIWLWVSKDNLLYTNDNQGLKDYCQGNTLRVGDARTTSGGANESLRGAVGEVMIFNEYISFEDAEQYRAELAYKWAVPLEEKMKPGALVPEDGSVEVPIEGVTLSWKPGMNSTALDVYFGTDFDDVNTATPNNDPAGAYKGRQSQASFALPPLDYGQTYYWRVDSINGGAVYSSAVVSFDTIKYAYPMASAYIAATASSSIEDVNAVNTVNSAGLNADNLHNTNLNDMWLSNLEAKGTPIWSKHSVNP